MTGSRSNLTFLPLPTDDRKQRQPDITKAGELLGGRKPKVPLAEGLETSVACFDGLLKKG